MSPDLKGLPEPISNLLQNIDLEAVLRLATTMNPEMIMELLNNILDNLRQSMKPEDLLAFEQVVMSLTQAMQEQKNLK